MTVLVGRKTNATPVTIRQRIREEGEGVIKPIMLPWPALNKMVGNGLKPGCVTILAGSPGASKSFAALNIALCCMSQDRNWKYLPIEDEAMDWIFKAIAIYLEDWQMIAAPSSTTASAMMELARHKLRKIDMNHSFAELLPEHILENPRLPVLVDGVPHAPDVPYEAVLDVVRREAAASELIIIDPVSQIDFSTDGKDFVGQSRFMRDLTGIVKVAGCHVILVAHLVKRPGRSHMLSTIDDLQGSADFGKLAHYVLMLDRHEPRESDVLSERQPVATHKLTMTVAKARGGFTGARIAMDLNTEGPTFREYGVIKPKETKA